MDEDFSFEAWRRYGAGAAAMSAEEMNDRYKAQASASMNLGMHGVDMRGAANMQNIWRTDEPWQPMSPLKASMWSRIKRRLFG
jgi:hypothetical protein